MQTTEAESGSSLYWMRSLRLAGGVLLGLFALDVADSVVPVQWMNPAWELQVIGAIIERSPVPLLGFVLFFYGDGLLRSGLTRLVARGLSWLALAAGLGLLLTLPLLVADTSRLIKRAQDQITTQLQEQVSQSSRIEAELKVAPAEALNNVLTRLGRPIEGQTEMEVRDVLVQELQQTREQSQARARQVFEEQRFALMKRSWKWGGQAILLGLALVYIWRQSGWARESAGSQSAG